MASTSLRLISRELLRVSEVSLYLSLDCVRALTVYRADLQVILLSFSSIRLSDLEGSYKLRTFMSV